MTVFASTSAVTPLRQRENDRVGISQRQLEAPRLHLGLVADPDDLEDPGEPFPDARTMFDRRVRYMP